MIEEDVGVGDLNAIVAAPPNAAGPLPGVVLVGGSGGGSRHDFGGWPEWIGDCGAVTLRHDKPGTGGSPGDWRDQSFADRAAESIAAAELLRARPDVRGMAVGLLGLSQGGSVSLLAAATAPEAVDFVITVAGAGVGVAEQERVRIERSLRAAELPLESIDEGLRWVDERSARLAVGDAPADVLADQARHTGRPWYGLVTLGPYLDPRQLALFARVVRFDPATVIPHIRCPILALFGAADDLVPVERSVAVLAARLPALRRGAHGIAVFPGADHGLFIGPPVDGVDRREQFAPGFLPMLAEFLARTAVPAATT